MAGTKINKLSMRGFKSFADKTEVVLNERFNCVVGPNGSGKSNVPDAICFVLGKLGSKSLRAEKTSHLIFDGGKKGKPASKAEVNIHFDNTSKIFPVEGDEIIIGRILNRKGQSKYKINGKTSTRTQILELLDMAKINPDGFNIVSQGDVAKFTEMSTTERRLLVEGLSDIGVYEEKKRKATNELNKVHDKLKEADIVIGERKQHLKELKSDRDYALRYKEIKDKIGSYKATYLDKLIKEARSTNEKLEKNISDLEEKGEKNKTKVGKYEKDIEEKEERVSLLNKEIEEKGEKEQIELNQQISDLRVDIANSNSRLNTVKDEISKIEQRKEQLLKDFEGIKEKIKQLDEAKIEFENEINEKTQSEKQITEKIEKFNKKNKIADAGNIDEELKNIDEEIENQNDNIHKLRNEQQELFREKDKIDFNINSLKEAINKVNEIKKQHSAQLDEISSMQKRLKATTEELNRVLDNDGDFSRKIKSLRDELNEKEKDRNIIDAKSSAAMEMFSKDMALKRILELKKSNKDIHGTIFQLGKTKERYSLALETCAGAKIKSVVVENDRVASELIKYLKKNKLGVVTFLPLNKVKGAREDTSIRNTCKKEGVHGKAIDLINFNHRYKNAFSNVFGNTLVVDDVDTARNVGIGRHRMITLTGDLMDTSGAMRGGHIHRNRKVRLLKEDYSKELSQIESDIANITSQLSKLIRDREDNEKKINDLRINKHELEGEIIKKEKSLHLDKGELELSMSKKQDLQKQATFVENKIEKTRDELRKINMNIANLKTKKNQLRDEVSELRNPRLIAEITSLREARENISRRLIALKKDKENIDMQISTIHKPEMNKIEKIIKSQEKDYELFKKELKEIHSRLKGLENNLENKEKASKKFHSQYKGLFEKRNKLQDEIKARNNLINDIKEKNRKIEIEGNKYSLKRAEIKARLNGLESEFEQYKEHKIMKNKNVDELKRDVNKFEAVLSNMDAVNLKALEIYEQVENEYNLFLDKKKVLEKEKIDVEKLMAELEERKKEKFFVKFNELNEQFGKFFSLLNNKKERKAIIKVENEKNPFEGGVEIKVKKKNGYVDIKSLSGGEKSLTALAFIFSIQEHEPHPFYILDEVDAALDKRNSEILAKMIKEYSDRAQYLVVTHNDAVLSLSDTIFGVSVTGEEKSKVVSLKL